MEAETGEDTVSYWKIKATLIKKDAEIVRKRCEDLEKELGKKKSEISSMKIALNYSDSFVMRKETQLREEVERLRTAVLKKTMKKKEKEKELINEISSKAQSIDNLLAKVQNLHNSLQYCRDDLEKYQKEYNETRYLLEIEKEHKEYFNRALQETEFKLETTKENFNILSEQLEIYKKEKEKFVEVLINRVQDRCKTEVDTIRRQHEEEKKEFFREQTQKLENTFNTNTDIFNSLKKYTKDKIRDLKAHYEHRIKSMIDEFAIDQSVKDSEISKLKEVVRQLMHEKYVLGQINDFLLEKTEDKSEELIELRKELSYYQEHKNYVELYDKIESTKLNTEINELSKTFQETQTQIMADYERKMRIIQQENEILLKHLQDKHRSELERIEVVSGALEKKEKKHFEVQIEYLLKRLEELETQKSLLECRTIEKIETDNQHLIDKNQELIEKIEQLEEKLLKVQKETEKTVRSEFVKVYKAKIQARNKKFEAQINLNEIQYSSRINTLTLLYEKKVEDQRKIAKEEFDASEQKLQQRLSDFQLAHEKLMTEHSIRFKQLNENIKELKFEVDIITRQSFQKQLLINDMNEEFKKRVVFLEDQLKETQALMEKNTKELVESKEKMQKDFSQKISETLKKHQKENEDLVNNYEKEVKDTRTYYKDKIKRIKTKHKDEINGISDSMGSTIENLTSKLISKSKQLKQQKSEITGLKTQVRYLDNSGRIFQFSSSKSPISQPKMQFENPRKTTFLRPTSLLNYKKPHF